MVTLSGNKANRFHMELSIDVFTYEILFFFARPTEFSTRTIIETEKPGKLTRPSQ
jgi:hypothetical protein